MVKKVTLCIFAFLMWGCGTATTPCGTFTFNGAAHANRGIDMTVDFDLDPAACGAPGCDCDTVAYVQIVRIIDLDTGNFLSPNAQQTNRIVTGRAEATRNGWAVDRLSNRVWGYYGRNNNGSFAFSLTPGSSDDDATLRDRPSGWPNSSWFDAVSVPVCINGDAACVNKLTGYYYWLFAVAPDGVATEPFDKIGVEWNQDAFDEAVIEWDNDAPGLGKNVFPAFIRMP